jgi:thiazole synthase
LILFEAPTILPVLESATPPHRTARRHGCTALAARRDSQIDQQKDLHSMNESTTNPRPIAQHDEKKGGVDARRGLEGTAAPVVRAASDPLMIAGRAFRSRLLVGTGKFSSPRVMRDAIDASGGEIVTVALRRVDIAGGPRENILEFIDQGRVLLLPNTSGARTADEAVRLARLARTAGLSHWVKLEVTPDPRWLLPDPVETLRAAETLVAEGFVVLPYINADPILAKRLEEAGCATVMPLGSPIGSNRGVRTRDAIGIIIEQAKVPVVVDAGLGAPSDAAQCLEMGADAVLVNTAIAIAEDPVAMARAFALGVEAGRAARLAGVPRPRASADGAAASSPLTGFLE